MEGNKFRVKFCNISLSLLVSLIWWSDQCAVIAMNGIRFGSLQQSAVNDIFLSAPYIANKRAKYLVSCMAMYLYLYFEIMHMQVPNLHGMATELCMMGDVLVAKPRTKH